jgi:hypothetical protein
MYNYMQIQMKRTCYAAPLAAVNRIVLDEVIAFSPVRGANVEDWTEITPDQDMDMGDITLPF